MHSKGHLSLTNKGMKTSGPPSSYVKLVHKKNIFSSSNECFTKVPSQKGLLGFKF